MNEFTCYNADGSVDVFTSKERYEAALTQWAHEREVVDARLGEAVDSVLAAAQRAIAFPKLVNMALCKLQPSVAEYDATQAQVEAFIKRNANDGGRYSTQKGKGGGYLLTPTTEAPAEAPAPQTETEAPSAETLPPSQCDG